MGTKYATGLRSALLVAALSLTAMAKPNLTGTWKLDASKSEFGPMPGPSSMTRVINHTDPTMTVKTTQAGQRGEFTTELKYTTDGKESVNTTRMGDVKSVVAWEGDTLIVKYKINNPNAGELNFEERWDVEGDGKTMNVKTKVTGPAEPMYRKMVFTKE
ncbi:MAG: hypothetical protein ABI972_21975 [Acidobacteriota bacterium]